MADFTHFNDQGRARMVDVGEKDVTHREAVAAARVLVNRETFDLIRSGGVKKGDVLMILEAMKMENEIMAPCDGAVTSVSVTKGAAVESGTLLCTIG